MGAEGVGSLYLIRAIFNSSEPAQASQFTLVTYLWLALNVIGNAVGFVAARATARIDSRTQLRTLSNHVTRVARWALLPPSTLAGLALGVALAVGGMPITLVVAWAAFLVGHVLRLSGLVRLFVLVGDGQIGSDKWYQLAVVVAFYTVAIPCASADLGIMWIAFGYLATALIAALAAAAWQQRQLPPSAPTDGAGEPVESVRSMLHQCLDMLGYAGAGFLAGNADALVARSALSDHEFVQYALAAKLGQVIALAAGLIPAMLGPRITRLHRSGDVEALARVRRLSLLLALAASVFGALILLTARTELAAWLSPARNDVLLSIVWLMGMGAVLQAASLAQANAVNNVAGRGLIGTTLASAACAVIVSLLAARPFGAIGIAAGTVAGSVVMLVGLQHVTQKAFGQAHLPASDGGDNR